MFGNEVLHCTVGAEAWQLNGMMTLNKLPYILQRHATFSCRTNVMIHSAFSNTGDGAIVSQQTNEVLEEAAFSA